jgi:Ca2+-transporting ATPase
VTVSFLTLASAQLWHVFDMRGARESLFRNDVTRNPWVWGALALCFAFLLAASHLPVLAGVLALHPIGRAGWWLVLGFGVAPVVAVQGARAVVGIRPIGPRAAQRGSGG